MFFGLREDRPKQNRTSRRIRRIVAPMSKQPSTPEDRTEYWNERAIEALGEAQRLPEGSARTAALKAAALLREATNMFEFMKPVKREK